MLASITLFVCTHKAFLTKHNSTFDLLRNFNLLLGNQVRPSTTHWRKVFPNGHDKNDFSCFPQPLGALFRRLGEFIGILMFRRFLRTLQSAVYESAIWNENTAKE